jgi:hypothetical protein
MKKRSHRNTTRLTVKERARAYLSQWGVPRNAGFDQERSLVRHMQAAVRQALARKKRRAA